LRKLLGVTQKVYDGMVTDGSIGPALKAVDLNKKIEEFKKYVLTGKRTKRDEALKVLSFLNTLKKNGLHPKDLMLTKVPIIPSQYRPTVSSGGMTMTADVNNLYRELIMNNNSLKDMAGVPEDVQTKLKASQYAGVKAVYGLGDPINKKSKDKHIRGLLSTSLGVHGGSAKSTMFQSKVVNKTMDLVGRAVISPDAKLDLDQVSVPQDMLWHMYKPFLTRRLVMGGVPATKATEYIEARNPVATRAMNEELLTRPGIVSRDPALHKYNLTGFYLVPNPNPKDTTVKLNPLVFKGFNMDTDGDQVNVSIPAGEDARKEVLEKMLPSRNLISPKTMAPMYTPSNEAALGLYQMTTEKNHHVPIRKFKNNAEVAEAYHKNLIHVGDPVEVG
jgi:DNA-directed RNA polymerase subunit beta'